MTIEHGDTIVCFSGFNILIKTGAGGDVMLWSTDYYNLMKPISDKVETINKVSYIKDNADSRKYHPEYIGKLCILKYRLSKEKLSTGMKLESILPIIENRGIWKPTLNYIPHNYHKIIEKGKQEFAYMKLGHKQEREGNKTSGRMRPVIKI